ncbi:MAG TPA: GNAT family N-acetyltransferase [Microbacteriaceae bacterium]|nr:GNAT family N-acetyltransferase [Microbacteriaceae bacterium]
MRGRTLDDGAVLRAAKPRDVPAIHARIVDLAVYEREPDAVTGTPEMLRDVLFGPDARVHCHVIERDDEILGIALWFLNYSTWTGTHGIHLEDLFVLESERGRGYGKAFLAELARICVARGYARFEWSVLDWNEPSIAFYRSLGAEALDDWTGYRLTGRALAALADG